uniref:Uncharacterized protein n=1 Tax=Leptobrachium leishanense TaxID=445787 RepID=A0A8C5MJM4_9ANUR
MDWQLLSAACSEASVGDGSAPGTREPGTLVGPPGSGSVTQIVEEDDDLPSTKGDLRRILEEIRGMWRPEVAAVRAEVEVLRAQVTEVRGKTDGVAQEQSHLSDQLTVLRSQVETLTRSVETLESRHRRRNVLVRGIPASVLANDLLPYVERLALQVSGLPSMTTELVGAAFRVRKVAAFLHILAFPLILHLIWTLVLFLLLFPRTSGVTDLPFYIPFMLPFWGLGCEEFPSS